MKVIYVINGPNLNMLGIREPEKYGIESYDSLIARLEAHAKKNHYSLVMYQSNHEGDLVDQIQNAYFQKADGIVINPAAYTHSSIAILDALKAVKIPTVEVHITELSKREEFRQRSYIREVVKKTIMGHGLDGYIEAVEFLLWGDKNRED